MMTPLKSAASKKIAVDDSTAELVEFLTSRKEEEEHKHKRDLIDLYDNLERHKIRDP